MSQKRVATTDANAAESSKKEAAPQADSKRVKTGEEKPSDAKQTATNGSVSTATAPASVTDFSKSLFGTFSEPNTTSASWPAPSSSGLIAPSALGAFGGATSATSASASSSVSATSASEWASVFSAPASSLFTETTKPSFALPPFSLPASFVNPFAGGGTASAPLFGSAPVQPKGVSRDEGDDSEGEGGAEENEQEPVVNPTLISKPAVHITGEEQETHVHSVRCKLFQLDEASNKWKEKGAGQLRINASKDQPNVFRLVMRSEGVYRLLLNSPVWSHLPAKFLEPSCVCIAAVVDPETLLDTASAATGKESAARPGLASFLLKTARKDEATELFDQIEKAKSKSSALTAPSTKEKAKDTQTTSAPVASVSTTSSTSSAKAVPTPPTTPASPLRRDDSASSISSSTTANKHSTDLPPPSPKTPRSPPHAHTSSLTSISSSAMGAAFLKEVKATELLYAQNLSGSPSSSHHHPAKLVFANPTDTAETILKLLSEHNIYAVPVMSGHGTKLIGSVDLADLAAFLVSEAAAVAAPPASPRTGTSSPKESSRVGTHQFDANSLLQLRNSFFSAMASKLSNFSRQNNMITMEMDKATVWDVIKRLSDNVRRVALTDSDGRVVKIASQSTVVAFLSKYIDRLGPKIEATLDASKCISRPLVSISPKLRALDAFVRLVDCRLSALAYLGDDGDVLGNISVKDLKGVLHEFNNLLLPVEDFVNINRRAVIKDMPALVSIQPTDTIHKAIQKLAAVGVHRLYVFSEPNSRNPIGMVALSDVLRFICKELSL